MNYLFYFDNCQVQFAATGIVIHDYLKAKIAMLFKKLGPLLPPQTTCIVTMKEDSVAAERMVTVCLALPGEDLWASDRGESWKLLLKNVEKRLLRQLQKRKMLLKQNVNS